MFYDLLFAERHNRPALQKPWSQRHSFIYHRHPGPQNCRVFLTVSASEFVDNRIIDHIENVQQYGKGHPLEVHIIILQAGVATWRECISHVAGEVQKKVRSLFYMVVKLTLYQADQALVFKAVDQEITDRVDLEPVADMLAEIHSALSALKDVCDRLQELHDDQYSGKTVPTSRTRVGPHSVIGCALSEIAVEIRHYKAQASHLSEKIRRAGQLVRWRRKV